jgi:hypothetical protein
VKAVPVAAEVPVLPSVIVIVEVPPTVMEDGEKVLLTVTAAYAADAAKSMLPPHSKAFIQRYERRQEGPLMCACEPALTCREPNSGATDRSHRLAFSYMSFPCENS